MVNQTNKQTFYPNSVGVVSNRTGAERLINSKVYHSPFFVEDLWEQDVTDEVSRACGTSKGFLAYFRINIFRVAAKSPALRV